MVKKVLVLLAVLMMVASMAFAFDGYIDVTNDTGYDIYFLYISHEDSNDWEEDVLGADILIDGDTLRVTVTGYRTSIFDVRAVDEDGDSYTVWDIDIAREDVVLTLADLD